MKPVNLSLDYIQITELLASNKNPLVESLLNTALETVKSGQKVFIMKNIANNENSILRELKTEEDVNNFKVELNKNQAILKRTPLN